MRLNDSQITSTFDDANNNDVDMCNSVVSRSNVYMVSHDIRIEINNDINKISTYHTYNKDCDMTDSRRNMNDNEVNIGTNNIIADIKTGGMSESDLLKSEDDDVILLENAQSVITTSNDKLIENALGTDVNIEKIQKNLNNDTSSQENTNGIDPNKDTVFQGEIKEIDSIKERTEMDRNDALVAKVNNVSSYTDAEFEKDLNDLEQLMIEVTEDEEGSRKENEIQLERNQSASSKRSRSDSDSSTPDLKKSKVFTLNVSNYVYIVPKNYPEEIMTPELILKIQTIMSDVIDKTKELPLLKCHGIQNGVLVYGCHNESSLLFIEMCLSLSSDFKLLENFDFNEKCYRMKITFNSLLENVRKFFDRLELYNSGLNTENWCATDVQKCIDHIIIDVELDKVSHKYICERNCCLFAGIDVARFNIIWD